MKTYILTILNPDNSLYWKEQFISEESLKSWIEEEKTRPYWKDDFTHSVETIENHSVYMAEIMAEIEAKRNSAKNKLKALGLTDDEIQAILGL